MILDKIIEKKRSHIKKRKEILPLAEIKKKLPCKKGGALKKAILEPGVNIIAEIKRASPSKGIFKENINPGYLAKAYEEAGAAAISVLTEKDFFLGDNEDLVNVKSAVKIPVLRKDFIIEDYQIYESSLIGADGILLIKSALEKKQLKKFIELACDLGLDPLVEVHTKYELEESLECDAEIIGINNRNLKSFKTDITITKELANLVPKEKVLVSESGISSRRDIENLKRFGVDAYLIGEALVKSEDVNGLMRELTERI